MSGVTIKNLEQLVNYLNEITDNPTEYSTNGKINVGHYTLSGAYGGYQLQQIMNDAGGVNVPLSQGHISKRELYNELTAYIKGIGVNNEK